MTMPDALLNFKRLENKYLLSPEQYRRFSLALSEFVKPDLYPHATVCSLYYDDERYSLIRASIEGPVFKEKLRIRSYGVPTEDSTVFVELKKKFQGTVYKRRTAMPLGQARQWLAGETPAPDDSMTCREIDALLARRQLQPSVLISCDRRAFVALDNPELRFTFDTDLLFRDSRLSLAEGVFGEALLPEGYVLMELKSPGNAPLWLSRLLSINGIFPTSFSKYGTCYKQALLEKHFLQTV